MAEHAIFEINKHDMLKKYIHDIIEFIKEGFENSTLVEATKKYVAIALIKPDELYSIIIEACLASCSFSIEDDGPHFRIPGGTRFEEEAKYRLENGDYKMNIALDTEESEKNVLDLSTQLGKFILLCILNSIN